MLETLDAWRLWECLDFSWDIPFANRLEFLDALGELLIESRQEFKQSVREYGIDDDGGDDLDFMASYDNDWPDSY